MLRSEQVENFPEIRGRITVNWTYTRHMKLQNTQRALLGIRFWATMCMSDFLKILINTRILINSAGRLALF